MATGDLKGNLMKLEASLRSLRFPGEVDYQRLSEGDPSACLAIASFAFTSFSPLFTESLVESGVELTGTNDLRFIEKLYKILRDVFSFKPLLTKQQFLQFGFAERKVSFLCDVIDLVLNKHKELAKMAAKPTRRATTGVKRNLLLLSAPRDASAPVQTNAHHKQLLVEKHVSIQPPPPAVTEAELKLVEGVARLEQRLVRTERRLRDLERSLEGKVLLESGCWAQLESRVLLLESRMKPSALTEETFSKATEEEEEVSHTEPSSPSVCCWTPSSAQAVQDRLERIVHMMEDTSSILQKTQLAQ